jgi:hypothetical protein
MGEAEDRVVRRLPVDALEPQLAPLGQSVEHHRARLVHRGQLRGIAEQDKHREDFLKVLELPLVEHRGLVHEPDVQRILPPLPSLDEVRPPEPRGGERTGNRPVRAEERLGPLERDVAQPLDDRPIAAFGQPLGQLLVLRIVDRGVEDAVDGGRRHAAVAEDGCRLVRGGEDGERPPVAPSPVVVIAGHDLHARVAQSLGQLGEQHRLAGACLAEDGEHGARPVGLRRGHRCPHVHAGVPQHVGRGIPGFGLIVGEPDRGHAHARDRIPVPGGPPDAISRPCVRPPRRPAAPTSSRVPATPPPSGTARPFPRA